MWFFQIKNVGKVLAHLAISFLQKKITSTEVLHRSTPFFENPATLLRNKLSTCRPVPRVKMTVLDIMGGSYAFLGILENPKKAHLPPWPWFLWNPEKRAFRTFFGISKKIRKNAHLPPSLVPIPPPNNTGHCKSCKLCHNYLKNSSEK